MYHINSRALEIPSNVMYQYLYLEERYCEYDNNGTPQVFEINTDKTVLAAAIHECVSNIMGYTKGWKEPNTVDTNTAMQMMNPFNRVYQNISVDCAVKLLSENNYSPEVQLFKLAFYKYAGLDCNGLAVSLAVQSNCLMTDWVNEMIKHLGTLKDNQRKRKQKSDRMFYKGQTLVNEMLSIWGGALYCIRMDFGLNQESGISHNMQQAIEYRADFLKHARDNDIFPDGAKYIWFLDFHHQKGYYHHLYIFCDPHYVQNHELFVDNIGRFWKEKITNGVGNYIACHRLGDYKLHKKAGVGILHRANSASMQAFYFGFSFMCQREYYQTRHEFFGNKTFDTGTFRNRKRVLVSHSNILDNDFSNRGQYFGMAPPLHVGQSMSNSLSAMNIGLDAHQLNGLPPFLINIFLGVDCHTNNPTCWVPSMLNNGFILVTGQSGTGKTNSLKILCSTLSCFNFPVWVFDPHNDLNDLGFPTVLLSGGSESTEGINPLNLFFTDFSRRGMHDHIRTQVDMICRAAKRLGCRGEDMLQQALKEAYIRRGFSMDEPSPECKPPTFQLVIEILEEWLSQEEQKNSHNAIESVLSALRLIFSYPLFNRSESFDVEKHLKSSMHFDLSALNESVRFVAVESLLRQVFSYFTQLGPIPKSPVDDYERFRLFIAIDEAKLLTMTGRDPEAADRILNILVSEGRKFGIGLILVSQRTEHFSKEIRTNAAAKLVHKTQDAKEAKILADQMQLLPKALMTLSGDGDGFFSAGSSRPSKIKVLPYSPRTSESYCGKI